MGKLSLLVLLLIFSCTQKVQINPNIIGKWKIVAANNGIYHDYKTDSSSISKMFLDSLAGRKDSAITLEMFSFFVKQYIDYYFTFDENGNYQEIRSGKVRVSGQYTINTASQTIEVMYENDEKKRPGSFKFMFEKNKLKLFLSSLPDEDFELTLERSQ